MFRAGSRVEEAAENDNVRIMLMVGTSHSHHRNTAAAHSATVAVLQDITLIVLTDLNILVRMLI